MIEHIKVVFIIFNLGTYILRLNLRSFLIRFCAVKKNKKQAQAQYIASGVAKGGQGEAFAPPSLSDVFLKTSVTSFPVLN